MVGPLGALPCSSTSPGGRPRAFTVTISPRFGSVISTETVNAVPTTAFISVGPKKRETSVLGGTFATILLHQAGQWPTPSESAVIARTHKYGSDRLVFLCT